VICAVRKSTIASIRAASCWAGSLEGKPDVGIRKPMPQRTRNENPIAKDPMPVAMKARGKLHAPACRMWDTKLVCLSRSTGGKEKPANALAG